MKNSKRYLRVAGVLVIAGGTGHIMQYGGAIAQRVGLADEAAVGASGPTLWIEEPQAPHADSTGLSFIPGVAEIRAVAAPMALLAPPTAGVAYAALDTRNDAAPMPAAPQVQADCGLTLTADPVAAAMIDVALSAPCNPNSAVRIGHGALGFVATTNADGALSLSIPALSSPAVITAEIDGLAPAEARAVVPTLDAFDRVAVSWIGVPGIELHAFEFGADNDAAGHVWRGNARNPSWAERAAGGFTTLLGDAGQPFPQMAEVYTFPAAQSPHAGVVRLTLEAAVTGANCGGDVVGRAVQVDGGTAGAAVELTLAMPDCDAVGDFLVLNNLFRDLKIAAR